MSYYYNQYQDYQPQNDYLRQLVLQKVATGLMLAGFISFLVAYFNLGLGYFFLFFVLEIVAIIGYFFARKESTIETLYYLFVVSSAVLLGFSFQFYLVAVENGMALIFNAFGITALIVGGIYYYTETRKPDVTNMVRYLFPLGMVFIVVMIAGLFFAYSDGFALLLSIFGAILFSAYLYYDLGRLNSDQFASPARMAFQIYWDILLVFKFILRILYMSQSRR